jgi:hypothetical protein
MAKTRDKLHEFLQKWNRSKTLLFLGSLLCRLFPEQNNMNPALVLFYDEVLVRALFIKKLNPTATHFRHSGSDKRHITT